MVSAARELELALLMADLCGYTALTETHGALVASDIVLRFVRLARSCLEPGVVIVDSIGDAVFCAGADTPAVVRTGLRLRESVERKPEFPQVSIGIHAGPIVEREGRLFGAPINLTAHLTAHALGGQILCTEPIVRAIGSSAGLEPRPIGRQLFKNMSRAVAIFELARMTDEQAPMVTDPVCRMQVAVDRAAATVAHEGATYHFCSTECARLFSDAPGLYVDPQRSADAGDTRQKGSDTGHDR